MITTFEKMRESWHANQGRGLWVGMFPEPSEDLTQNRTRITSADGYYKELIPTEDLHVTLAHLGKNHNLKMLDATHAAVELAASLVSGELAVLMTGVLRLKWHVAIALVPDEVIVVRHKLRASLRDRDVVIDDKFAGIPHMTVARMRQESISAAIPSIVERRLVFRGLTLVLGDDKIAVPFSS